MSLFKKLSLFLVVNFASQTVYSSNLKIYTTKAKDLAAQVQAKFNDFYKIESIRTALIRSCMTISCLADGECCSEDMLVLTLAAASILTATSYQANLKQRYSWLPAKFNLLADGIATLSAYDASWLPITSYETEKQFRNLLGYLSTTATGLSFLPK